MHAVQVNLADHELGTTAPDADDGVDIGHSWRGIYATHQATELLVELSPDGHEWSVVRDARGKEEDAAHAFVVLDAPHRARFVRVTGGRMPFDGAFAVSGVRVFGTGDGPAPAATQVRARRVDQRTAHLEWDAADGAIGYNVRYGRHPQKLYHSWQVYERTELELRSLNADVPYWVAVDAFGEGGITTGETVAMR